MPRNKVTVIGAGNLPSAMPRAASTAYSRNIAALLTYLVRDGDVIVTNDPYSGGQHLPDILTFRPVCRDGQPIAIVGVLCHHIDIGGGAPGSYDPEATEIYQEGLRIPPVKLFMEYTPG